MTTRELNITKAVLDYLHSLDFGQAIELQIHAKAFGGAFGTPKPSVDELEGVLKNCNTEHWIAGVPARFQGKMKWNITDAGEAARLQMTQ